MRCYPVCFTWLCLRLGPCIRFLKLRFHVFVHLDGRRTETFVYLCLLYVCFCYVTSTCQHLAVFVNLPCQGSGRHSAPGILLLARAHWSSKLIHYNRLQSAGGGSPCHSSTCESTLVILSVFIVTGHSPPYSRGVWKGSSPPGILLLAKAHLSSKLFSL